MSIFDSGFLLGEGVWEGIRLHRGRWAFLEEHLDWLTDALRAIDLDLSLDRAGFRDALERVRVAQHRVDAAHARLMVTRGTKNRPFQHPTLSRSGPTVAIIVELSRPCRSRPVRLATVPQVRGLPHSQDPKRNTHSKRNGVLAAIAAEKAGADEALLLDVHEFVNPTNAGNFFGVRGEEVWTSTGDDCLPGITRAKTMAVCREAGIPVRERNFSLSETHSADEAFLTGTFGGQVPIGSIDGRTLGGGGEGPLTRRIRTFYEALVERETGGCGSRRDQAPATGPPL